MKSKHKKGAKRAAARRAAAEKVAAEKVAAEKVAAKEVASKRNNRKNASLRREAAKRRNSTTSELIQWLIAILVAFIIALFVDNFLIVNAQIPSGSMENTIMTGDRESQLFIKRIIGLPGETVEIRDGHIYIDGSSEPLEDVETKEYMVGNYGPYTVPEGCYFVMGDNRNDSKDSRYWINPYVSKDKILGKAVFRYWPITEMKTIK